MVFAFNEIGECTQLYSSCKVVVKLARMLKKPSQIHLICAKAYVFVC